MHSEILSTRSQKQHTQWLICSLWAPALSQRPWILVDWKHTPITEQHEELIMLYGSPVITFSSHFAKKKYIYCCYTSCCAHILMKICKIHISFI